MASQDLHERYHGAGLGSCTCICAYCHNDEDCRRQKSGSPGQAMLLLGVAGAFFLGKSFIPLLKLLN